MEIGIDCHRPEVKRTARPQSGWMHGEGTVWMGAAAGTVPPLLSWASAHCQGQCGVLYKLRSSGPWMLFVPEPTLNSQMGRRGLLSISALASRIYVSDDRRSLFSV